MNDIDWITYVPRRIFNMAVRLEAVCEQYDDSSPIGVAEYRYSSAEDEADARDWYQVWRYLMESHNVTPDYNIKFVVVDDPALDQLSSVTPEDLN